MFGFINTVNEVCNLAYIKRLRADVSKETVMWCCVGEEWKQNRVDEVI